MKLIDRDKFINDMFDFYIENRWSPRDIHFSLLDVRSNIDSPEYEVKAILIEWIRQYIHLIGGSNGVTKLHKEILKTMVNDWEKENENR